MRKLFVVLGLVLCLAGFGQAQCTSSIVTQNEVDGFSGSAVAPGVGYISGIGLGFYAGNGPTYKPSYAFAAQPFSGDSAISAELISVGPDGQQGEVSVAAFTSGSSSVALSFQKVNGSVYMSLAKTEIIGGQYVHTLIVPQGSPVTLPLWIMIDRAGTNYWVYTSPVNNIVWTLVSGAVTLANDSGPVLLGVEADAANSVWPVSGAGSFNTIYLYTITGGVWTAVPVQMTDYAVGSSNGIAAFSPVIQAGNLMLGPVNINLQISTNNQCGPTPVAQITNTLKILNSSGGVVYSTGADVITPQVSCAGNCQLSGVNNGTGTIGFVPLTHGQAYSFVSVTNVFVGTTGCGSGCVAPINFTKTIPLNP